VQDTKKEVEEKVQEFVGQASKKLGFLFAVGATLSEKDKTGPIPLEKLPQELQNSLCKLYKEIVHVQEDKDITLEAEALHSAALIDSFLQKTLDASIVSSIEAIMNDKETLGYHYKISAPKIPVNQYSVSQPISVGKSIAPEVPKMEEPAPIQVQEHKEPAKPVKEPEPTPVPEVKQPVVDRTWAEDKEEDEEEEQKAATTEIKQEEVEEEGEGEDEFQTATDKGVERKKKLAEGKA